MIRTLITYNLINAAYTLLQYNTQSNASFSINFVAIVKARFYLSGKKLFYMYITFIKVLLETFDNFSAPKVH